MRYKFIRTYSDFILNETLKTFDIDITFDKIDDEMSLMNYDFELNKNNNVLELKLNNFFSMDLLEVKFEHINTLFIDRFGWFPSKMILMNKVGRKNKLSYNQNYLIDNNTLLDNVIIIFEAKYDLIQSYKDIMYHLSIQNFENDIIKKGLIPKSKSKISKHLDRIYLCDDVDACYKLISQMKVDYMIKKSKNQKYDINYKWIIFEIDMKDLELNIYDDPNYLNGFFIVDNINPSKISIYDKE